MPPCKGKTRTAREPPFHGFCGQSFFGSFFAKKEPFRIFPGSYPLCKGVIHVEIVENPVEKVENSPVFSVETVENPVEIPRQRVLEEKFSTIPSWRRGRLLDKGPGYVYNKNNQNCAKE